MIALKLVFQSLAGVGAVVGVAGGGFYTYSSQQDLFFLVTASATTTNPSTKELFLKVADKAPPKPSSSTDVSQNNKKYECKSTETKEKTSACDIYSLTFDSTKKTLLSTEIHSQIKNLNTLKKVATKAELILNKFFLLKASPSLYKDWTFDSKKTINLASTEEATKSFATLTVHAMFNSEEKEGTTNFVIAKASTNLTSSVATLKATYECKLENMSFTKCLISALTEASETTPTLTFEANKYYLIKWTSPSKYSLKDLKPQTLVVVEETTGTEATKKTLNFDLELPLIIL